MIMIKIIKIIKQIFKGNECFILFHVISLFKLDVCVSEKETKITADFMGGGQHNLLSA